MHSSSRTNNNKKMFFFVAYCEYVLLVQQSYIRRRPARVRVPVVIGLLEAQGVLHAAESRFYRQLVLCLFNTYTKHSKIPIRSCTKAPAELSVKSLAWISRGVARGLVSILGYNCTPGWVLVHRECFALKHMTLVV